MEESKVSLHSRGMTSRTLKLHAGATCVRSNHEFLCVILMGGSGAGKTTLVRLSEDYGMIPLADDAVELDSRFTVIPADDPPVYDPNRRGKLRRIYILSKRDIDPELALFFRSHQHQWAELLELEDVPRTCVLPEKRLESPENR